jgi:hypothetical protein
VFGWFRSSILVRHKCFQVSQIGGRMSDEAETADGDNDGDRRSTYTPCAWRLASAWIIRRVISHSCASDSFHADQSSAGP